MNSVLVPDIIYLARLVFIIFEGSAKKTTTKEKKLMRMSPAGQEERALKYLKNHQHKLCLYQA